MIVVDANVVVPLLIGTEESERIQRLWTSDSDWVAPRLWNSEVRNVLLLFIRKQRLTLDEAIEVQLLAEELLHDWEFDVPSTDVLSLAHKSGCSTYHCEYVALAKSLAAPLYTFDKRILRAFPEVALRPS